MHHHPFVVVRFHDHRADLVRRARQWGYPLGAGDFADLRRFAAALALAEADAWDADEPHVATRAYEDRRFLLGSLCSGVVDGGADPRRYEEAAARWERLAAERPGTAALWHALASRAATTATRLRATPPRPNRSAP